MARPPARHSLHLPARLLKHRSGREGITLVEMVVVMLVIAILTFVLGAALSHVDILRTSNSEAEQLQNAIIMCRKAALQSNEIVYLEFNLDTESYRAYRINRTESEVEESLILKPKNLAAANALIAIVTPSTGRIVSGILKVVIPPSGESEEMAIYLGDDPLVKQTVLYHKYSGSAEVVKGEAYLEWKNDTWEENLEDW